MSKRIPVIATFAVALFLFPGLLAFTPASNADMRPLNQQQCTMDVQCGVGKKCSSGVCTGGIAPKIKGRCLKGDFGKKVCSNTGKECMNDSQCFQ